MPLSLAERAHAFDQAHGHVLRRIWIVGGAHGQRRSLLRALEERASTAPRWLIFAGNIGLDREHGTFDEWLRPLYAAAPGIQVAWIPGDHDSAQQDCWERLQACGAALPLHGFVLDLDGVHVAGLGGSFQPKVWSPPDRALVHERRDLFKRPMLSHELRNPIHVGLHTAIYEAEWEALAALTADILITHEAPSPHPRGFDAIDDLARALGVVRAFHGCHHEDPKLAYREHWERLGFQAIGLAHRGVRDGLGEVIDAGDAR